MNAADFAEIRKYWGNGAPQTRILARDVNSNPTYIAVGPRGDSTATSSWLVEKLTYDANGLYSYSQHSPEGSVADNYLTLVYA